MILKELLTEIKQVSDASDTISNFMKNNKKQVGHDTNNDKELIKAIESLKKFNKPETKDIISKIELFMKNNKKQAI